MYGKKEIEKLMRVVTARALLGRDSIFDESVAIDALNRLRTLFRVPTNVVAEIVRCVKNPSDRSGNIVAALLSKHTNVRIDAGAKEAARAKAENERLAKKESLMFFGVGTLFEVFMGDSEDPDDVTSDLIDITAEQYRKTYGALYDELHVMATNTELGDDYGEGRDVYTLWGNRRGDQVLSVRDCGPQDIKYMGNPKYLVA